VAVEIGDYHCARRITGGDGNGGLERSVAVAVQNRNIVAVPVGDREIGDAVAIEVGGDDGAGVRARCEITGRGEHVAPAVEEDGHASVCTGNREVVESIAV